MQQIEREWLVATIKDLVNEAEVRRLTETARNYSYIPENKKVFKFSEISEIEHTSLDVTYCTTHFLIREDILRILDILFENSKMDEEEILNMVLLNGLKGFEQYVNKVL